MYVCFSLALGGSSSTPWRERAASPLCWRLGSMPDAILSLMQCSRAAARTLLKVFLGKMVTSAITVAEEVRRREEKEEKEESILALLGIIGTVLNLCVIVFVYVYTTLWRHSNPRTGHPQGRTARTSMPPEGTVPGDGASNTFLRQVPSEGRFINGWKGDLPFKKDSARLKKASGNM